MTLRALWCSRLPSWPGHLEPTCRADRDKPQKIQGLLREAPRPEGGVRLFFPDFALSNDRDGARGRVLVEVVGYWTKDYLADKQALLRAAGVPLVVCVDERHAGPDLVVDPRVLVFRRRIDAHRLLEARTRALATPAT